MDATMEQTSSSIFGLPFSQASASATSVAQPKNVTFGGAATFAIPIVNTTQSSTHGTSIFGFSKQAPHADNFANHFNVQSQPQTQHTIAFCGAQNTTTQSSSLFINRHSSPASFSCQIPTQPVVGTIITFVPTISTDTMIRDGFATTTYTRNMSLTAMKQYEAKSFEELRMEDYNAGRKPTQPVSFFSQTMPSVSQTSGFFRNAAQTPNTSSRTFAQLQNNSIFRGTITDIKWNHFGVFRRFQLHGTDKRFTQLLAMIRKYEPNFQHNLAYIDKVGDRILLSDDAEWDSMLKFTRKNDNGETVSIETFVMEKSIAQRVTTKGTPIHSDVDRDENVHDECENPDKIDSRECGEKVEKCAQNASPPSITPKTPESMTSVADMMRGMELAEPVDIKWNHFGVHRRFQFSKKELSLERLMEEIRKIVPSFQHTLSYIDEDGDKIVFVSDFELQAMLKSRRKKFNKNVLIKIDSYEMPDANKSHNPLFSTWRGPPKSFTLF